MLVESSRLGKEHGLVPADVVAKVIALGQRESAEKEMKQLKKTKNLKENVEEINKLRQLLIKVITSYGGVKVIDQWLTTNDPGHVLISEVSGVDWTFLPENLRP